MEVLVNMKLAPNNVSSYNLQRLATANYSKRASCRTISGFHNYSLKTCYSTSEVVIVSCTVGLVGSDPVSAVLHSELPHTQLNKLLFVIASLTTVQHNTLGKINTCKRQYNFITWHHSDFLSITLITNMT